MKGCRLLAEVHPSDLRPDMVIFCCNVSIYKNYEGKKGNNNQTKIKYSALDTNITFRNATGFIISFTNNCLVPIVSGQDRQCT